MPNWVERLTPDGNRPFSDLTVLLETRVGYDESMTLPPRQLERTAAIYARKSTDQSGVSDEQRSVARQVEHARTYAQRKGWASPDHVFVDDGISGAEFANRPGFLRLMNALKPRPPFQVLVMSEESRLGREAIETAYALKQLVQAGVRVFFYLEDRERTLDSPTDKIMLSLTAFADELEREKARQRTYDAMARKAGPGKSPAAGSSDTTTTRSAIIWGGDHMLSGDINEAEAAVVRRIFTLCADGAGKARIAAAQCRRGPNTARTTRATQCVVAVVGSRSAVSASLSRRNRLECLAEAEHVGAATSDAASQVGVGSSPGARSPDCVRLSLGERPPAALGVPTSLSASYRRSPLGASSRCGIEISAPRPRAVWGVPGRLACA